MRRRVDTNPKRTPPYYPGTAKPTKGASRTDLKFRPPTKLTPTAKARPNHCLHTRSKTTKASTPRSIASRNESSSSNPEPG
ncbi:hypothetical protein F2Q68_00004179 [Brassica cretica]|uniref:Uncharacterized protein n=2 Tax=Brassica cretica TaxID=69181 RepID=A0A8S9JB97_BRACR|nr:hypothetical protein F2Q68_00004179 [Brassica cretica]KAF3549330.1 hypothetical protein DY000_02006121 [Brassica cretica]